MSVLFSPASLRGLTVANRIFVSPMCQYFAQNGAPNNWHLIHLGTLAVSGAGMLFVEGTAVEPEGRITPGDLGLWDDATEAAFRSVIEVVRKYSDIPMTLQLAHAGRKASSHVPWRTGRQIPVAEGGWLAVAPSSLAHKDGEELPAALDGAGLARIREAFASAAKRAARLGFNAVEIHGAHGYLLHEFMSPLSNQRDDEYGGTLTNRLRFPLEVFDAVRAAFPSEKPVGMKLSVTDWVAGGWDQEQTIELVAALKRRGADWVTASSGGVSPLQKITVGPGYQVPFARAIRDAVGISVIAVGLITEPRQAEEIVGTGNADFVALARGMLYDPRWPWHAAAALGATVKAPSPYWRSQPQGQSGLFGPEAMIGIR
jgi:2,4-dienoyl-CoA reductase-like NADH-dependent reductase (Old Yellow Enzyme family)